MNTLLLDGISGGAPKLHTSEVTKIKVDLCTQKCKHAYEFTCSFSCSFTVASPYVYTDKYLCLIHKIMTPLLNQPAKLPSDKEMMKYVLRLAGL